MSATPHLRQAIARQLETIDFSEHVSAERPAFILVPGKAGARELRLAMRDYPHVPYRCWRMNEAQQADAAALLERLGELVRVLEHPTLPADHVVAMREENRHEASLFRAFIAARYPHRRDAVSFAFLSRKELSNLQALALIDIQAARQHVRQFVEQA